MQKNEERPSLPKARIESDRSARPATLPATTWITDFHQDPLGDWVASLSCGHTQHLRHQPPWQNRAWVRDPSQRKKMLGQPFPCGWCAQGPQQTKDS